MALIMGCPTATFLIWIFLVYSRLPLSAGKDSAILVSVDEDTSNYGGIYFYTGDGSSVSETSPYNFTRVRLTDNKISSMDANAADGSIYFFDFTSRCIYSFRSGNIKNIHCGISSSVFTSIAYDWISGNMYWTDGFFNWIAVQPVDTTDRNMYRVIIQDDIEKPRAMAVDSKAGYIFWFDISTSGYRIERALMDGTTRVPIITTSLLSVLDIEIDAVERRLYWTESGRNAVESSLYDGTDRKVVYKEFGVRFHSIAADTDYLCTTIYDLHLWACFYKSTGSLSLTRSGEFSSTYPGVITMYQDGLRPIMPDGCSTLGCEHFCVNLQPSGKCMCKEGYTLDTDGLHCTENHPLYSKAIVVSNATNICMLSFRTVTNHSDPLRCVGNVVQGCQMLTVDASNKLIYYVDTTSNFIREYNMATDSSRQIATVGTVSGMVFDWTDGNLYWSESTTGKVKYVTIATTAAKELVQVSSPPSHLTIDPHTRTLFWVEGTSGFEMRIVSMSLVINEKSVILTHPSPAYIKDIFFDVLSNRLFFVQFDKLSRIERNGSGIHHYYKGLSDVDQLIIFKRYAIWTSTTSPNVYSIALEQRSLQMANLTNNFGVISGLAVYDESLQRLSKGPCSHLNGGCEQLCMTGINGRAVCACSYGLTLQNDGRSCGSVPQSSKFILATDINHGRLLQISTTNAQITTLDINGVGIPSNAIVDSAFVYWTDIREDSIMKSTLNGSHVETVYTSSGVESYINALAMDHSSGNLYYTVTGEAGTTSPGSVGVLRPSTGLSKTLVGDLSYVEGLVLYPSKGLMFYTHDDEDDSFTNIILASMDGTSPSVIIALDPEDFLTDLTIDYTTDRLYWSSLQGGVESSSLSGSARVEYTTPTNRIRSIAIDGDYLYLTSERKHKIVKMQNEKEVNFMTDNAELGFLHNIFVYPGQSQTVSLVCANNNGGCSTFCLPKSSPSFSYCACQDGVDLKSDDPYTRERVMRCPSAIPNGKFVKSCTHIGAEVCTFQCDLGYTSTTASDTLTCGQDGEWNENLQLLCKVQSVTTEPTTNQQTMIYVGAGLAGLVILSVTVVAIVCVVTKRRRRFPDQRRTMSEPNVYYTHDQSIRHQHGGLAAGMVNPVIDDPKFLIQEKIASFSTSSVPTPPVRPDSAYDTISPTCQNVYSDPAPPYEEATAITHGPSVRSETSMVSVQRGESDYLTLIHGNTHTG